MTLVWMLLAACWTPRDTGPRSMVGHLLDADATPIAGQAIETVEARWITESDGRFAINYKEPSRWLTFERNGVWYQRTYLPSDEGTEVAVQLPALAPALVICDVYPACDATLTWELGPGFIARARVRCDRDEASTLAAVPTTTPASAVCRQGATAPDEPLHVWQEDGRWRLSPPAVDLAVTVSGAPPGATCTATVNGTPLTLGDDARFHAQVHGRVVASAICDGVPAVPRALDVQVPFEVALVWNATTPTLDLQPYTPWADRIVLHAIGGLTAGWYVELQATTDGTFKLPPLDAGAYVIGANMAVDRVGHIRPATSLPPGSLHYKDVPPDMREGDAPEASGLINLDQAVTDGQIPIVWYED